MDKKGNSNIKIPNGNHGLFHRFGIEALTIEGFSTSNLRGPSKVGFLSIGRIIEGIFRSLNNLLERLHQSYFFYLLPSSDRFISIGLYMPSICLIAGALFIMACAKWCQLKRDKQDREDMEKPSLNKKTNRVDVKKATKKVRIDDNSLTDDQWIAMKEKFNKIIINSNDIMKVVDSESMDVAAVLFVLFISHFFGVVLMNSPHLLQMVGNQYNLTTEVSLFAGFILISFVLLLGIPFLISFKHCSKSMTVFHIIALLELGTALICVSMNNFSLALFVSIVYVPFALLISSTSNRIYSFVQKIIWLMVHPLIVLIVTVLIYTYVMFPGESVEDNFYRGIAATQQAIVFSIVDSIIYGNWLFSVVTSVFLSNWLCFWCITFSKIVPKIVQSPEKKTN